MAAIAAVICGSGSGHGTGCMHTTYPIPRPDRDTTRQRAAAVKIMARNTARAGHNGQHAGN